MLTKLLRHPQLTAFGLGWLAVTALPPYYLFPMLFVSFSGLLLLLNRAISPGQAFKIAYAYGAAYFGFGLAWIGNALLIDASTAWLYPIVIIASGAFFGLFVALPGWLAFRFQNLIGRYFAFAALWVLFEWIRSWFLTGFPWNLLGSVLAFDDSLIQFASLSGTYGLSMIVLLAAMAPAFYFRYRSKTSALVSVLIPLLLLGFLWGFGTYRLNSETLSDSQTRIRMVQPAIPQTLKWNPAILENNLNRYIKMSQAKGIKDIDFTIWGETASPFPLDLDSFHLKSVREAVPPHGFLITGLVRYEFAADGSHHPLNSLFVIDREGKITGSYDKSHLVPFGEYIPLRRYLPEWIKPLANVIGTFKAGPGPQTVTIPGQPGFGGLICYEVIFPHQIINPDQRPEWIVNLTNDGWYGDSAGPRQHLVSSRLRAVEEGITVARVANTGISALISPYGIVLGQISLNDAGILDINLPNPSQFSTTYGKYGDLFALIWCFSNIILAFYFASLKL